MAIWMDMTNSLKTWQGAIVGVVRAELEIARHYKKMYPDLRISVYENNSFVEIPEHELNWLWETENVGDSYLNAMGRKFNQAPSAELLDHELNSIQATGMGVSNSRVVRLKAASKAFIAMLPLILRPLAWVIWWLFYFPVKTFSAIRTKIKWSRHAQSQTVKTSIKFSHPYCQKDTIITAGWIESDKEMAFSKLKGTCDHISLIYVIYDLILIREGTTHFYGESLTNRFREYFEWVSLNCDYILYGGSVAQADGIKYQKKFGFPILKSDFIKFGANILQASDQTTIQDVKDKYKIEDNYILAVGSIEPRKNYDTIYKAYNIMMDERSQDATPQLVIIGKTYDGMNTNDLLDTILTDPRTAKKIIIISPNDDELDLIYKNCQFVILPSLYEGWSLTLPEALQYKKFCLVSDAPPIREVGQNFVAYIDPIDLLSPRAWADKIWDYFSKPEARKSYETKIASEWISLTWKDCATQIQNCVETYQESVIYDDYNYYFDVSLLWHSARAGNKIAGILRTELMLIRNMSRTIPNMRFYAYNFLHGYQPISKYTLRHLLGSKPIDVAYNISMTEVSQVFNINEKEVKRYEKTQLYKLLCSALPYRVQKATLNWWKKRTSQGAFSNHKNIKAIPSFKDTPFNKEIGKTLPFKKNDIIFSPGTGSSQKAHATLLHEKQERGFRFTQIVYDMTPLIIPQVHRKETIWEYTIFIEYVSEMSDLIFYGGKTAMKDCIAYQKQQGLPLPEGYPIKFGSDIIAPEGKKKLTEEKEQELLEEAGIEGSFVICVGTIELRKNHETLYKAYLQLLEKGVKNLPQLIFVGHVGWKTQEAMDILRRDKRVKDKIILLSPDDEMLDLLYRRCEYTILASLYEGWSLTLPESLSYGKFCLTADNEPLRETGEDFVEYVTPFDVAKWGERIQNYAEHPEEIEKWEEKIRLGWKPITWKECAKSISDKLLSFGDSLKDASE